MEKIFRHDDKYPKSPLVTECARCDKPFERAGDSRINCEFALPVCQDCDRILTAERKMRESFKSP